MPAKAACQSTSMRDVSPLSLASSHRGSLPVTGLVFTPIPCRSRLAGEGGVSVDINAGCQSAFAGKPAPTRDLYRSQDWSTPPIPCRSRLAGESGVSVDINAGCQSAFAGKPAPTGDLCRSQDWCSPRFPVGAGLPAKAACQSTSMRDVSPLSLASQLPHEIFAGHRTGDAVAVGRTFIAPAATPGRRG